MCRILSTTGRHNGFCMGVVATHYSEDRLPARYQRKKTSKSAVRLPTPEIYKRIGQANGRCKVNDEAVYAIRAAGDAGNETLAVIARRYGISESYAGAIINRTKRAELPERK